MRERKWFGLIGLVCIVLWIGGGGLVQTAFKQSAEKSQMYLNVTEAYSTVPHASNI